VILMIELGYYEGIANEMLGRLNRIRYFTKHKPSIGFYHEEILRGTVRQLLSPRFQLRSGFSFNTEKDISYQGDILIIDENDPSPYLFQEGNLVVAQARAVVGVIEVKSTLNKKSFTDAVSNLASFIKVGRTNSEPVIPANYIFAFNSQKFNLKTLNTWYKNIQVEDEISNYPYAIFAFSQGMLQLFPRKPSDNAGLSSNFGHYVIEEKDTQLKTKSLSLFLSLIRKIVERREGLETNPFALAQMDGISLPKQCLRYGTGLIQE
jgi:hypothetical protein